MTAMDKRPLMDAVLARLDEDLARLKYAADQTRAGAIHEESRPENDKDTRALEASYLARGEAMRVEEMVEAITRLRFLDLRSFGPDDPIGLSALVSVEVDGAARRYLLVPVAGGLEIEHDGERVMLLTPASPVGRALVGRFEGDDFVLTIRRAKREYEIVEVR